MSARANTWPLVVGFCLAACVAAFLYVYMESPQENAPKGSQLAHARTPTTPPTRVPTNTLAAPTPKGATMLTLAGTREPSGALALPGKGIILVVDDEPKRAPRKLGLFAYRVVGKQLQHLPVGLQTPQARDWDDWEGIATDGHYVVLMTSHSNRKGKRARFCRFPLASLLVSKHRVMISAALDCVGGKKHRKRLKKVIKRARKTQGFSLPKGWKKRRSKAGGLDMEAIAYAPRHKLFVIGLRGPLATRGGRPDALFLAMRWEQGSPQFQVAGLLDLGGRGVRAMTRLPSGGFLLSAGPTGTQGNFRLFHIKQWPTLPFTSLQPRALRTLPSNIGGNKLRPEGLATFGKWLFLFSDSGNWSAKTSAYALVLPSKQVLQP